MDFDEPEPDQAPSSPGLLRRLMAMAVLLALPAVMSPTIADASVRAYHDYINKYQGKAALTIMYLAFTS